MWKTIPDWWARFSWEGTGGESFSGPDPGTFTFNGTFHVDRDTGRRKP